MLFLYHHRRESYRKEILRSFTWVKVHKHRLCFHFYASQSINQFKKKKNGELSTVTVFVWQMYVQHVFPCTKCWCEALSSLMSFTEELWEMATAPQIMCLLYQQWGKAAQIWTELYLTRGTDDRSNSSDSQLLHVHAEGCFVFVFFLSWILMNFWREQKQNRTHLISLLYSKRFNVLSVKYVCQ